MKQKKDCRDKSASMTNPNPPDEVRDGKCPRDGNVDAPDSHTLDEQVCDGNVEQHQQQERHTKADRPAPCRASREHDRADFVGNSGKRVPRL